MLLLPSFECVNNMSHFGRAGPPDIRDTYSLLVLNITFRTSADDLFPLFDRYGKVVDIFIPRDRRTGESRGFAFVRYKHAAEAQKAIERLDGRNVDGRDIVVQYAKYGRNDEAIHRGKITQGSPKWRSRSRSRSPKRSRILNSRGCRENVSVSQTFPPSPGRGRNQEQSAAHQSHRYRDDCYERVFRRRSRSRSRDWHDRHHHRRMEVYRRGSPSGSQGSISRSNSQSLSTSDLRELRPSGSAVGKPLSVMGDSLTQALSLTRECQGSLSPTRSSLHSRTPPHGAMQEPRNGNPSIVEVMSSDHDGDRALAAGRSSSPARGHHPPDRCPLPPDPHGLSPHP